MGLAMGLLQAGGPSRMPTTFGQALGQGMQTGQQFQSTGVQNAMQKIQLEQAQQGQQYFQGMLNGNQPSALPPQPNADASQAPAAIGTAASAANAPAQASPVAPQPAKLPALMDPTQDPRYLAIQRQAMIAKHFGQDSTAYDNQAKALVDNLNSQEITLTPEQAKLLIPGGTLEGQSIKYKPYSGDWSVAGESAMGTVPVMTPAGTMANVPYDKRSGQVRDIGGVLKTVDYTQPLKDTAQESIAQRVAAGMAPPPVVSSRNPGAANQLARADSILKEQGLPGYDASTWPSKQKAVTYWNTGPGATQVTAFNAAESHLETLKPLIDNLNNTKSPAWNHLANFFKYQTGSTAPTDFSAAKQYVGGELAKVVSGAGGTVTEGDRMQAQSQLSNANSPEQLKSAVETIQKLIGGKVLALKTQYTNNGLGNFEHRLEGPARQAMQSFEAEQGQQPQSAGGGKTLTYDPATGTFK